jgi:hypothetical protein
MELKVWRAKYNRQATLLKLTFYKILDVVERELYTIAVSLIFLEKPNSTAEYWFPNKFKL